MRVLARRALTLIGEADAVSDKDWVAASASQKQVVSISATRDIIPNPNFPRRAFWGRDPQTSLPTGFLLFFVFF